MLRSLTRSLAASRVVCRTLSSAQPVTEHKVDKDSLMKLRKRTGYSYVNCRKALVQFGSDQLSEAEKWLRQNAEKEGWAKAAKLSSRQTSQGLVAVKSSGDVAIVIELNCETDFVARGEPFKELLTTITDATLAHAQQNPVKASGSISRQQYDVDTVKTSEGKSLKEVLAMSVGRLGENLTLKRVEALFAPAGAVLHGAAHPKDGTEALQMGKFVSIIAMERKEAEGLFPTERLAAQICQHIIGMRSETLGAPPSGDQKQAAKSETVDNQDELNEFFKGQTTEIDDSETALLRQAFMLNPSQTIHEYVTGHQAKIVDFVRAELGEGSTASD